MLVGIIILVVYFAMAALMISKKLSTFLALSLMAFAFSIISGEPIMGKFGLLTYVIPTGASALASTMLLVVFACWLGKIMEHTGVTKTIIKKAAEFGGDKPLVTTFAICVACSLLFTVLNGTGAVALVGTIALPILLSVGLPPVVAASAYLATYGIGSLFNPVTIGVYMALTKATQDTTIIASVALASVAIVSLVAYILFTYFRHGRKFAFAAPIDDKPATVDAGADELVHGFRGFLACMTPVVVIAIPFIVSINLMITLLAGVVWICIFTWKGGWSKFMFMMSHAVVEGWEMAAPTCSLMIAVGFLVTQLGTQSMVNIVKPAAAAILPTSALGLIIFIAICAPLALYRGVFNPWGMGAGLAAVFLAGGAFSLPVYYAFFFVGGRWCNVHDPSSTQCIWSANFAGTDMVTVMKHQFVWDWTLAIIGAAIIIPIYVAKFPL